LHKDRIVYVTAAIEQLNSLLPLKARQDALSAPLRELHRAILESFAAQGLPPSRAVLSARPGIGDVDAALAELAAGDLVVLNPARDAVTGAYPFTVEERVHRVRVNGHTVHAMCALDALSIAPMFGTATQIESRCHVTEQPIAIDMQDLHIVSAQPATPRVGIRWQGTSGCAAQSLCLEMVFLYDAATAGAWQREDPAHISLFDLPDAVAFGAAFFRPLLD
jgi:mercuric reductase